MPKTPPPSAPSKKALQIRVDSGLHERLTTTADQLGISFNALAEGILAWAMQPGNFHPNEMARESYQYGLGEAVILTSPQAGAIWFGTHEQWYKPESPDPFAPEENEEERPLPHSGNIHFALDYTPQSHIRIPPPPPRPKSTLRILPDSTDTDPQPVSPPKPPTTPKPKRKHP